MILCLIICFAFFCFHSQCLFKLNRFDFVANMQLRSSNPFEKAALDKAQDEGRKKLRNLWVLSLFCSIVTPIVCCRWFPWMWPLSLVTIVYLIICFVRDSRAYFNISNQFGQALT